MPTVQNHVCGSASCRILRHANIHPTESESTVRRKTLLSLEAFSKHPRNLSHPLLRACESAKRGTKSRSIECKSLFPSSDISLPAHLLQSYSHSRASACCSDLILTDRHDLSHAHSCAKAHISKLILTERHNWSHAHSLHSATSE